LGILCKLRRLASGLNPGWICRLDECNKKRHRIARVAFLLVVDSTAAACFLALIKPFGRHLHLLCAGAWWQRLGGWHELRDRRACSGLLRPDYAPGFLKLP
jgi:hypothetical protein